jgi:preprotein translocase subunit SecF
VEFIKKETHFDFVGKIRNAGILSCILIVISAGALIVQGGPKYGIDFAGGTLIQVKFTKQIEIQEIRNAAKLLSNEDASVQPFGEKQDNEYLINIQKTVDDLEGLSDRVSDSFLETFGQESFEIRRVEMVGPKVGKDLRQKGFMAVICSLLGMLTYIWWRFELKFGVGAIIALTHDVIITLGALTITGRAIDLPMIAAILTVVGYSVNDTIIVCDRIRETTRRMVRKDLGTIINTSINLTLTRTIITSLTTLLVVITLFIFGGPVIHDFAFTLIIGILVGTYSSVFIASPVLILWERLIHDKKDQNAIGRKTA